MSSPAPVLVWFRQDLRLGDNPAVAAAAASGRPLIFAFVLDDATPGRWRMGAASRWWLERSLRALAASLARLGGRLILRRGAALQEVQRLAAETGAAEVRWSRVYEPSTMAGDATLKAALEARGVAAEAAPGALLHEPGTLKTGQGGPFKVFTPFWRTARARRAHAAAGAARAARVGRRRFERAAGGLGTLAHTPQLGGGLRDLAAWRGWREGGPRPLPRGGLLPLSRGSRSPRDRGNLAAVAASPFRRAEPGAGLGGGGREGGDDGG